MKLNQTAEELATKKLQAKELWLKSVAINHIAKTIGIGKQTLYNWAREGNWDVKKIETTQDAMEAVEINIQKEKERSLKIIKGAESLFVKELKNAQKNGPMPKSTGQFSQLQRVKWEILMPRTIQQYNFMKQENQIGPAYTLEIINPNDNKDAVETEPKTI